MDGEYLARFHAPRNASGNATIRPVFSSASLLFSGLFSALSASLRRLTPVQPSLPGFPLCGTCAEDCFFFRDLQSADVILVGVSRSGKTPTSLYLAMQHGLKAANYPLIPEDFERRQLPPALLAWRHKLFGLSINPQRLAEIRSERRPGSRYASLENCRMEVSEAEAMMRRSGIRWLSTTTKSIEEIATTILQELHPQRLGY